MKPILIVGGGITGMTAAIEAAEIGWPVVLIEKEPYLGGQAIGMNRYFPKMCPPYCGMEINFRRIKENPLIRVIVETQLVDYEGSVGEFVVTLETEPELVNSNCTRCNKCIEVCPVERKDGFNQSMSSEKCINYPHDLAFPERYTIDSEICLKEDCGKCVDVCSYKAINLIADPKVQKIEVQTILLATGWQGYDPAKLPELSFGKHPDIISNLMMERMQAPNGPTNGSILLSKEKGSPKQISFVQCAGSRDLNHNSYCSGVCCSASLKQALHTVDVLPEAEVDIHYIDLRVSGRNEDFLKKVEDHPRINLIKGKVSQIHIENEKPRLTWENIDMGLKETGTTDLVVLATGMIPDPNPVDGLLNERRSYMDSIDLPKGISLAGSAIQPMDIVGSTRSGTGKVTFLRGMISHQTSEN